MRNITELLGQIIPPANYQYRNGFTNDHLIDSLSPEEKIEVEKELIKRLENSDDCLIGETLAYMMSVNSVSALKTRLNSAQNPASKILWASSINKILRGDEEMKSLAYSKFQEVSEMYTLIGLFDVLAGFNDHRINERIKLYQTDKEYLIAYNALRVLGQDTSELVERERAKNREQNGSAQTNIDDGFPPKPELKQDDSMVPKLLFSLALFVLAYYTFFDKDIKKMAILVVVLLIHELGHFLAMKYFRYTEVKMFFIPFLGALVTGEKQEVSQRQRAIILLAGPVPGIVIGAVLYYVGIKMGNRDFLTTASIFIFLNAANLLPLTPLDGGRLIETLFFNNRALVSNIFTVLSAAVIAFIALRYKMYTLLIIPFFMLTRFRQLSVVKQLKESLTVKGLDYNKPFDALTNREYWLIREQVISDLPGFTTVPANRYEASPRERQIIQNIRSLAERQPTRDLGTGGIILFALIWFVFLAVPAAGVAFVLYQRTMIYQ